MLKKYLFSLKGWAIFLALAFTIGASNAYTITLNGLAQSLRSWITLTHFNVGGNYFGGLFILTSLKDLWDGNSVNITLNSSNVQCGKQVKGYYWTPLRATALYPLDNDSKSYWPGYNDLTLEGWFYTDCRWPSIDTNNIVWQIKYIYRWTDLFSLQAGIDLDPTANKPKRTKFAPNFGFWNSNFLIWFLWDSEYGVSFVWGELDNPTCLINATNGGTNIEDLVWWVDASTIYFTWTCAGLTWNTYWFGGIVKSLLGIVGGYSVSQGSKWDTINLGQISGTTWDYYRRTAFQIWWSISNISQIINQVNKNAEILCRWKATVTTISKWAINCITPWQNATISQDLTTDGKDTYIILRDGNLIVKKSQKGPWAIHVFIDKWNMLIDNNIDTQLMDSQGELASTSPVTFGTLLRWNFIIRWLIGWWNGTQATGFKHKLYIHWMLATYNTLDDPNPVRKNYIINELGWDSDIIKFEDAFSWRCQDTGLGTDGAECSNPTDQWATNPIIIIKKIIPSLLLR